MPAHVLAQEGEAAGSAVVDDMDPEKIADDLRVWIEDPISIVAVSLLGAALLCLVVVCCRRRKPTDSGVSPDTAGIGPGAEGGILA